jgi:hypothetical protein
VDQTTGRSASRQPQDRVAVVLAGQTASEVEAGDRIRESAARPYRSGVIEVRPILEQFIALRQVAKIQDRAILFQKGQIADCRRAVEDRDVNKSSLVNHVQENHTDPADNDHGADNHP